VGEKKDEMPGGGECKGALEKGGRAFGGGREMGGQGLQRGLPK